MPHNQGMKNYKGTPEQYAMETAMETPVVVVVEKKKRRKKQGVTRKAPVKW